MAWNRSSEDAAGRRVNVDATSSSRHWWYIAGTIVILGAAVAAWWLWPDASAPVAEKGDGKAERRIREVKPVAAPKAKPVEAPHEPTDEEKRLAKIKYFEDRFGTNMPIAIRTLVDNLKRPPKASSKIAGRFDFLKHSAERDIASILSVEPGTYYVIKPVFGANFNKDFLKSIEEPTEIAEDDSSDIRLIKESVNAAKKELVETCKREGKLPCDVMSEYTESLYDLGRFQRDLEADLSDIYNAPEYSDAEVKDFCTAANKMLEEKGLNPLPYPNLTERSLELHYNQKAAERNQNEL